MNFIKKFKILITGLLFGASQLANAGSAATSGISLLETSGARPSALGEAFTAATDDVTAMHYNPASIQSLTQSHMSLMYESGLVDNSFGQINYGSPKGFAGSIGYYDGGETQLFDGTASRTVTAEKDLIAVLGFAKGFGALKLGVAGKYLSSELAETAKATAYAADFGMQYALSHKLNMGASIQNIGSKLQYDVEKEELPQMARLGVAANIIKNSTLFVDGVYSQADSEIHPAIGFETNWKMLAIRAGYKGNSDVENISFGMGFLVNNFNFDYAFGMVEDLDHQHRVSLGMRFGSSNDSPIVYRKEENRRSVVEFKSDEKTEFQVKQDKIDEMKKAQAMNNHKSLNGKVYTVQPGDTLGKIARKMYGDSGAWKRIYSANKHILSGTGVLEIGQRIALP